MKKILLFIIFSSFFRVKGQTEIGAGFQGNILVGIEKNIGKISTNSNSVYIGHTFKFNDEMAFYTEINYVNSRYIMDGLFFQKAQNVFEITPYNYKQSLIRFHSIQIPIFLKGLLNGVISSNNYQTISLGPILDYTISVVQKYKIGNESKLENFKIENKINARIGLVVNQYANLKSLNKKISFGIGGNYQLTEYLNNGNKSFKPLSLYLRFGVII